MSGDLVKQALEACDASSRVSTEVLPPGLHEQTFCDDRPLLLVASDSMVVSGAPPLRRVAMRGRATGATATVAQPAPQYTATTPVADDTVTFDCLQQALAAAGVTLQMLPSYQAAVTVPAGTVVWVPARARVRVTRPLAQQATSTLRRPRLAPATLVSQQSQQPQQTGPVASTGAVARRLRPTATSTLQPAPVTESVPSPLFQTARVQPATVPQVAALAPVSSPATQATAPALVARSAQPRVAAPLRQVATLATAPSFATQQAAPLTTPAPSGLMAGALRSPHPRSFLALPSGAYVLIKRH